MTETTLTAVSRHVWPWWMVAAAMAVGGGLLGSGAAGCRKHAPTSYELDVRAGHPAPPEHWKDKHVKGGRRAQRKVAKLEAATLAAPLGTTSLLAPIPLLPPRTAPVVTRVWVADQRLGDGSWLQGTWMWLEREPAHWLDEVDPGGAPFAVPQEDVSHAP